MISNLDSAVIDANCEAFGISISTLMVNAGNAVSSFLKERFSGKRIAFVCGNGNNGGDGITAAGMMDDEDVTLFLLKPADTIRSEFVKKELLKLKCPVKDHSQFKCEDFDIIVDCALGTGISGKLRPPYVEYVTSLNRSSCTIISVDVPSGLGTDLSVNADITITFHDIKEGMDSNNSGEIIVTDIGIPKEAYDIIGPGDMKRYPVPLKAGHKGSNGRLLIIGGGPYYGAPAMSALAALRVGTDIVRLAVPKICSTKIAAFSPVFTITELQGDLLSVEHVDIILSMAKDNDAVLIGPGIGTDANTKNAVRQLMTSLELPIVVDADGLTALGDDFRSNKDVILTPHLREYERLGGAIDKDMRSSVSDLARKTSSIILLKGNTDIISDGETTRFNNTGNPGMTGAGTGDVLAGIVAGLLAKGMCPFDAAALGSFISGRAGDIAFEEFSYGLMATDVIDSIPKVLKEHLRG